MASPTGKTKILSNLPTVIVEVGGVWTGGGAATNCTRATADHSAGVTSVNYNAATGRYKITLAEWGAQLLPGSHITIHRAAAAAPLIVNLVRAITVASGAATVLFDVWDVATPTLTDLATTDTIDIVLRMAKSNRT